MFFYPELYDFQLQYSYIILLFFVFIFLNSIVILCFKVHFFARLTWLLQNK